MFPYFKGKSIGKLVPSAGLEPARPYSREILSLLCLPFHHEGTDANIDKHLRQFPAQKVSWIERIVNPQQTT